MYNWDSPWEEFAFVVTLSTCDSGSTSRLPFCSCLDLWFCDQFPAAPRVNDSVLFDERNISITTSHKSREGSPSILKPATNEIVSDSVELWGRRYIRFLPKSIFLSPQSRQQNLGLGTNPIDTAEPCFPHDNIVGSHYCDECMKSNKLNVGHKLLSIWWLIEQVCSLNMECRVYQFAPSTSMSRKFLSTLLTTLQLIQVPLSWNGDHPSKDLRLCVTALSFSSSQYLSTHFCVCPSKSQDHVTVFEWGFSHPGNFSVATAGIHVIKIWSGFVKINILHPFLPHRRRIMLLSSHFWYHRRTPIRLILVFDEQTGIANSVLFPIQVPLKLLRTVFPTRDRQVDVDTNFVQEEPLDLQCWTMIWAILCRGRRIHISGHWILSNLGASSILTPVHAGAAPAACPPQSGSLAMTSMTSAVIWDADEPCSVETALASESSCSMSPRSTTRPLYLWSFGSNSTFSRWQMSINVAKWTFFSSHCASRIISLLLFTLSNSRLESFRASSIPCPLLIFHMRKNRDDSKPCLVCSWASTMDARFVFAILMDSSLFALQFPEASNVSLCLCCKASPPSLELPTYPLRLWFLYIHHLPDRWKKCLSTFEHCWALAARLSILALLSSQRFFSNFGPHFRPHLLRSGSCLNFC